jgi:hypothetical protein
VSSYLTRPKLPHAYLVVVFLTALPAYRAGVAPAAYRAIGRQHRRRLPGFAGGEPCRDGAVDAYHRQATGQGHGATTH